MLHPTGLVEAAASWMPTGLMGLVKVVQYWTFSLFYCSAELWGSVVISVLFWTLANEVCTVAEAKSVYPLMGIAANVALVLSGAFVKLVNRIPEVANGSTQAMLNGLVGGIVMMTAAMVIAKASLDKFVIGEYCALDPSTATKPAAKKKSKGNLADSFRIIRGSTKITSLAVLVVSYGVSHRLFEFSWKGALRALYPTAQGYQGVLADVAIATGYATISFMLLGKFVFQYLGWRAAASVTPLAMLITGGSFFGLSLAASYGISVGGLSPVAMAFAGVTAGAATQVFARSSKFSFFDPAKEMCYIEMSKEEKSKGKAAVDLLGSQIGKSGGAWITQLLLLVTGSLTASLPIISIAFLGVIGSWLAAVNSLNKQLKEYEAEKEAAEKAGLVESSSGDDPTESVLASLDEDDDNNGVVAGVQPQMAS
jgi:AAA family ATP:ADP antiporter